VSGGDLMFKRFKVGLRVGIEGFKFLFKYPKSLVSILIFWFVFAMIMFVVYGLSLLGNDVSNFIESLSFLIMTILLVISYSISISIASLFLLELIEQHETTGTMSIKKALADTIKRDVLKTIPLIIIWSVVIFVIRVVQFIIAFIVGMIRSALHIGGGFNWNGGSSIFNTLLKGVRVFIFFALPAIAWEELSTLLAIKKSWKVIKTTWVEIIGAITFSNMVFLLTIIPILVLYFLQESGSISEDVVIYILIIMCCFMFSFTTLIQQLFSAEIYLWFLKWETTCKNALQEDEVLPNFNEIDRPTFFDQIPNLAVENKFD